MNSMSSLWEFLSQDTAFFGGPQSPMLSWLGSCGIVLFFVWQLIRLTVEVARARRKVAYRYARLSEAKLDRAASHAAALLYGAPTLEESEAIVLSLEHAEIERAWRRALVAPRLTSVLAGA